MEITGRVAEPGVLVVEYREDVLDASKVKLFKETFLSIVGQHAKVVLDLEGVRFVDSSGMGALIACLRAIDARKGELRLTSLSGPVRALFELMRMHRVFGIHADIAEAIRALH
jgi:anti-sigma B factor antagonist